MEQIVNEAIETLKSMFWKMIDALRSIIKPFIKLFEKWFYKKYLTKRQYSIFIRTKKIRVRRKYMKIAVGKCKWILGAV